MISYKDTTFCSSPACVGDCGRQYTKEVQVAAEKWWGSKDVPIAFAEFCSKTNNANRSE